MILMWFLLVFCIWMIYIDGVELLFEWDKTLILKLKFYPFFISLQLNNIKYIIIRVSFFFKLNNFFGLNMFLAPDMYPTFAFNP